MSFQTFCDELEESSKQSIHSRESYFFSFNNTVSKTFIIDIVSTLDFLVFLENNHQKCIEMITSHELYNSNYGYTTYQEKPYRELYKNDLLLKNEKLVSISSLGESQTKPLTQVITKLICFLSGKEYISLDRSGFDTAFEKETVKKAVENIPKDISELIVPNIFYNSKDNKYEFIRWMRDNKASSRTIKSYSVTVMNYVNRVSIDEFNISDNIYEIDSYEKFISLSNKLKSLNIWVEKNEAGNGMYDAGLNKYEQFLKSKTFLLPLVYTRISKPFILLAGISGTGKTRFIRNQADKSAEGFGLKQGENYCLVPVRPDWHEPSDLLGYISRLNGVQYIATDFLKFVFKALCAAISDINGDTIAWKAPKQIPPFWLCLDEMNLAPVEQYFADYLSIIETREWIKGQYKSEPLLKKDVFDSLKPATSYGGLYSTDDGKSSPLVLFFNEVFSDILIEKELKQKLITYVTNKGLLLPPNLIVAGTVNMDETTHGFSRKVIDRALTFDFGEFFPNDFDTFFSPSSEPVLLNYPTHSTVNEAAFENVPADTDGEKSIAFLKSVNEILRETPFELAYRALNELLLSVISFLPENDKELQAVWDDFMMCKVLPRIDGDSDKLAVVNVLSSEETILDQLEVILAEYLKTIWDETSRPDLLRVSTENKDPILIPCRSKKKLSWMKARLEKNTFTSFWP